jgi:uncharacterized glyoxalase superfamily protein PhnB
LPSHHGKSAIARKEPKPTAGNAQYLGGGVALQVDDVTAAVRYYEECFGFDMVELDHQNRYASLRGGKLCFDLVDEHGAGTRAVGTPGDGVAMYVFVDAVEDQMKRLQEAGISILTRVNRKRAGVEEFSVRDRYGLLWIFSQAPYG